MFNVEIAVANPGNTLDITIPTHQRWRILSISVSLVASASAGNRNLRVEQVSGGLVVGGSDSAINISATNSGLGFWGPGVTRDESQSNGTFTIPIPEIVLLPDEIIRVRDSANIDAAEDVLRVRVSYETVTD